MALETSFEAFYTYDEMVSFLNQAQTDHPQRLSLRSLTATPAGRDVLLAEITDPATGAAADKPAYYIQAGLHAAEGAGTTAALDVIRRLLYNADCAELLEAVTFYVVPRVNPDGMEYALTTRGAIRSRIETDEHANGLIPRDMNDDGRILHMRWPDPAGPFREDDVDPRIMVKREPGDAGPFYCMVGEGEIRGYDGTHIGNATRTVDMNRNYAANWKPMAVAGKYPFCEPEVRAVGEFTLSHPNIFAGVDFHCGTNAILRLTTNTDAELNQSDLELTLTLGALAEEITGLPLMSLRDYGDTWRAKRVLPGSSNQWAYTRLGISHYVVELGNGFNSAGITAQDYFQASARTRAVEFMRRVLACHDAHESEIFVPWAPVDHPQLGSVEIGGILQGNAYHMVPRCMEAVIPRTTDFVLRHAGYHPCLILSTVETEKCSGDVYRIRATVANIGGLGTVVMQGGGGPEHRRPVQLRVDVPANARLLSRTNAVEIAALPPAGGKGYAEWFVEAPAGTDVTVRAEHPRGGVVEERARLD
ncbi:MAG: hypothetical protein HN849_29225 [Victivallales bacterium]|nr:hypothetical protein [Lentisphaerota bacterium]MBT7303647.1 hypothetical protein [Victivallales bacterium]